MTTTTFAITQEIEAIARHKTCGRSFQELLDLGRDNGYRPTILIFDRDDWKLARAYDAAQAARGDERRAYTGSTAPKVGDIVKLHAFNGWRHAPIVAVGPKRVRITYVTKGRGIRYHKFLALDTLIPTGDGFTPRSWKVR